MQRTTFTLRGIGTTAVGAVMGAAMAGTLLAAPAQAATAPASVSAQSCAGYLQKPYKVSGSKHIMALAEARGCGSRMQYEVFLQRSRWYGWQKMDTRRWTGDGSRTLSSACDGTHDWRLFMNVTEPGGQLGSRAGTSARLTC
ncbi:hypothetical protein HNR23_003497 [Nocardiopsis mwathae]|uniref:Secreted protein n=1 Tax=Nocardiopsis mwathae TaxID=1472723 RepID=A0A7W9YJY5_9ACTN|nr:hypothetical protein [Nocardiopsis mwathae]MBB6173437.1 hypothetical protein [Nocardiopsis mwathae]